MILSSSFIVSEIHYRYIILAIYLQVLTVCAHSFYNVTKNIPALNMILYTIFSTCVFMCAYVRELMHHRTSGFESTGMSL